MDDCSVIEPLVHPSERKITFRSCPRSGKHHPGKNDSGEKGRCVGIGQEEVAEREEVMDFTGGQELSAEQGEPQSRIGQVHGQGQSQRTAKGTMAMAEIGG